MPGDGARQEAPEFFPFPIDYSQLNYQAGKRRDAADNLYASRIGQVLRLTFQLIQRALVIFAWLVDSAHDRLVTFD